jgi:hypothetical protein
MGFGHFKSGQYVPRSGKCVKTKIAKYRSSWELMFCNLLDDCDVVKSWEFEQTFVKYYYGGRKRTYIIDFWFTLENGKQFIVEIKPATFYLKAMANHDMNYFKWEAAGVYAIQHNCTFKVLTEASIPRLAVKWKSANKH